MVKCNGNTDSILVAIKNSQKVTLEHYIWGHFKIMRYIDWKKVADCTLEERKSLIPYIDQLMDMKHEFELKGIYGFNEFIVSSADLFEKEALHLIMQGYMPEMCEKVLFNVLNMSNLERKQYLKKIIFIDFVLAIQKEHIGDLELKIMLLSYLGTEFLDILID